MQRDGVEQRLQEVVRALHLRRERAPGDSARRSAPRRARRASSSCSRRSRSAAVARAVRQRRGRCCRSGSRARSGAAPGPRAGRVAGERVAAAGAAQDRAIAASVTLPGRVVAARERQLEVELVEPVARARRRAAASPPSSGPSGVSIAARSPATTLAASPISTPRARACTASTRAASSASRSGAAKSVASKTRWTNVPTRTPAGMPASSDGRRAAGLVAPSAAAVTGAARVDGSSSTTALLGLAADARLVRRRR